MIALLFVLFLVVPVVELAVIVMVADRVGILSTIALLLVVGAAGAWLVKYEGLGVLRRMQDQLQRGQVPTTELVNGVLIMFAGALMLTPGFVTDLLGIVLLVPPTRALVRTVLLRRYQKRITAAFSPDGSGSFAGPFGGGFVGGRVFTGTASYDTATYDAAGRRVVDVHEIDDDGDPPGLGRS